MNRPIDILLFLSDYKNNASYENYHLYGTDYYFSGAQTNEAPIKCLLSKIKANQDYVNKIICIVTHKVYAEPIADNTQSLTQFELFKKFVMTEDNRITDNQIEIIHYDFIINSSSQPEKHSFGNNLPKTLYDQLSLHFNNTEDNETVYIDYTGGLRDISFLMTSIIRFLEFKGIQCEEIVYSHFQEKNIYDIHYIYEIYQLINGVSEFVNTGNARELSKVYSQQNNIHNNLISHLIEYSDALSICDIGLLDNIVNKLLTDLKEVESYPSEELLPTMLKSLAPTIRKKMYLGDDVSYPNMIRWCTENNMIQQAATIYTDKMPKYYIEKGLLPDYVDLTSIKPTPGHTIYDTAFFTELFDKASNDADLTEFCDIFRTLLSTPLTHNNILYRTRNFLTNNIGSNPVLKKGINRFISFINTMYRNNGTLIEGRTSPLSLYHEYIITGSNMQLSSNPQFNIPSSLLKLLNLIPNELYWSHLFLYYNESDYLFLTTAADNNRDKTYRKKYQAINNIRIGKITLNDSCNKNKLLKIMQYYLAIKLIRNRMNHASELSRSFDETATIEKLNAILKPTVFSDNITSYKQLLYEGINIPL